MDPAREGPRDVVLAFHDGLPDLLGLPERRIGLPPVALASQGAGHGALQRELWGSVWVRLAQYRLPEALTVLAEHPALTAIGVDLRHIARRGGRLEAPLDLGNRNLFKREHVVGKDPRCGDAPQFIARG